MLTQIFKSYELDYVASLLERVADPKDSIFLSPFWLLPWLKTLSKKPILMVCQRDQQIVGLAFWGCQKHWLGNKYYLNQTGVHADDQVWIEHNDIICAAEHRPAVLQAMLQTLSELPNCGRLIVQTSLTDNWQHKAYLEAETSTETNFYADLKAASDYIDQLSKNTRASIKRSNKLIEDKFGPITINKASISQNAQLFHKIAELHISKWGESEYGSGFTNPKFVDFHQQLLSTTSEESGNRAELFTLTAGDFTLGYLYCLIHEQEVLFYLSAINYADLGNKYKPGLSMHSLAIQHFKDLGYNHYDFLAGPARYKEQMSNNSYAVHHIVLYKNTLRNKFVAALKKLFSRLKTNTN